MMMGVRDGVWDSVYYFEIGVRMMLQGRDTVFYVQHFLALWIGSRFNKELY
jgi:hypothetical protein